MNKATCTYSGFMVTKEFGLQAFYGWVSSPEEAQEIARQLAVTMESLGLHGNVQMSVRQHLEAQS